MTSIAVDLSRVYRHRLVLVSPPRTGSTPVARLLWQHPAIGFHCHEPYEARYWGGQGAESVATCLRNPMSIAGGQRVPLRQVPGGSGLLVKEMSFQLNEDQFAELAAVATAPIVFVLRDPRKSTVSRLRIVRELYDGDRFPAFESGWPSLATQVTWCRRNDVRYVLIDSDDLRAAPAGTSAALLSALGLAESGPVHVWEPRPGLQLVSPEVGTLMSAARTADDPFYRRVLASRGIEPPDHPEPEVEDVLIEKAGMADDVAAWAKLHASLRQDPNLLVAGGAT
ncbi:MULTISPECIES: hypothetical protein [unclassified Amycolatopsis]|uniref:hypothetical protein n=1 Tax=unclassified Amycolatopsis TaxID=2618356 RepID=UPI002876F695|nr:MULTISPECIES: hypothetical protein [unclassified Amycolatopsis]MDS0139285.1 hypothetical protein [Amycolatopsis sp. 505]MDS0144517.1 hypothetical protein [Amycolatopsis sp. CM201R]